jgi:hypothetical protein
LDRNGALASKGAKRKGCRLYNSLFALGKTFVETSAAGTLPMTAAH